MTELGFQHTKSDSRAQAFNHYVIWPTLHTFFLIELFKNVYFLLLVVHSCSSHVFLEYSARFDLIQIFMYHIYWPLFSHTFVASIFLLACNLVFDVVQSIFITKAFNIVKIDFTLRNFLPIARSVKYLFTSYIFSMLIFTIKIYLV